MRPDRWLDSIDVVRFRRQLADWYDRAARPLPWRETNDLYFVLVSEIMLQQTQVATVLGYYRRFLDRFPSFEALAATTESEVLRLWQGLGYYRRARNLHQLARIVITEHAGRFPTDPLVARALPGLGRYSANAVLSLAHGQRLPILEANTIRLWTRLCAAQGDPRRQPLAGQLWELAERILPRRRPDRFNHAVMDLGAMLCTARRPQCAHCPVRRHCRAYQTNRVARFHGAANTPAPRRVDQVAVIVRRGRRLLVRQRPDKGQWALLWEFPRGDRAANETWTDAAKRLVGSLRLGDCRLGEERLTVRHGIMHLRVQLKCFEALVRGRPRASGSARWLTLDALDRLPFSAPQRRIIDHLRHNPINRRHRAPEGS